MCFTFSARAVLELALLMWAGQGLFLLFSEQQIRDGFFYRDVLGRGEASLESLGSLGGQLCLVLGVSALLTFLLLAAGTRALGKVGIIFLLFHNPSAILLNENLYLP